MRNSLASTFKSNKRYIYYYFYSSTWYIYDFFLFHIEIEGKGGWIIGGAKRYVGPPLKLLGGLPRPPPLFLRLCCTTISRCVWNTLGSRCTNVAGSLRNGISDSTVLLCLFFYRSFQIDYLNFQRPHCPSPEKKS